MELALIENQLEECQATINQLRREVAAMRPRQTTDSRDEVRQLMIAAVAKAGNQENLTKIIGTSPTFVSQIMRGHRAGYTLRARLIHYLKEETP
jgi:hypothetical protein